MEGYDADALVGADEVTVSFWVKSTQTGNFTTALRNKDLTHGKTRLITIDSTDTWERKSFTVSLRDMPGDWGSMGNTIGIRLFFNLVGVASSSNKTDQTDTWESGNKFIDAGHDSNLLPTGTDTIRFAQISMTLGSGVGVYTPAGIYPGHEFALCQRYFQRIDQAYLYTITSNAAFRRYYIPFPIVMRDTPSFTNSTISTGTVQNFSISVEARLQVANANTGTGCIVSDCEFDAELD